MISLREELTGGSRYIPVLEDVSTWCWRRLMWKHLSFAWHTFPDLYVLYNSATFMKTLCKENIIGSTEGWHKQEEVSHKQLLHSQYELRKRSSRSLSITSFLRETPSVTWKPVWMWWPALLGCKWTPMNENYHWEKAWLIPATLWTEGAFFLPGKISSKTVFFWPGREDKLLGYCAAIIT